MRIRHASLLAWVYPSRMQPLTTSLEIHAPPASVWAAMTDIEHCAGRIPAIKEIVMLTPGPVGLGTRWRETRLMFGRDATETMEIYEWQPGVAYTAGATNCGCEYRATLRCKPHGQITILASEFNAKPLTLFAKFMGAVMMPFMKNAMRKALRGDLDAIKLHCESQQGAR